MSRRIANLVGVCLPLKALVFCLLALGFTASPVRAQSSQDPIYVFHTNLGDISVQLFPDVAPKTVANFLQYLNAGAYNNSLIHRSVVGFIFQGGAYQLQSGPNLVAIPTNPPVVNEFHLSNMRGTIAMAKLGNDPNSATSQWFFNESDSNAANLDNQNGGFTVFGKIIDTAGLAVMDQIAAVPVPNPSPFSAPLNEIPLINYQPNIGVQVSNLVLVSSITPIGHTHVLWDNTDGTASVWTVSPDGSSYTHQEYGPFPGWTVKALADGPDGKTRLLWSKTDGTTGLWSLDNTTGIYSHYEFGPFAGWTAGSLSVGTDGTTHVLWNNTSGQGSVWNYDAAGGTYTHQEYGPFPGWAATALADGADGKTRLLWTNTDGTMGLWSLDNSAGVYAHHEFGPYSGWMANAVSVGTDNTTHILWSNVSGQGSVWNYATSTGGYASLNYGPFGGWSVKSVADGADRQTRLLWTNTDGTMGLWSLDNTTGIYNHREFGPFSGWTAVAVSAGP